MDDVCSLFPIHVAGWIRIRAFARAHRSDVEADYSSRIRSDSSLRNPSYPFQRRFNTVVLR